MHIVLISQEYDDQKNIYVLNQPKLWSQSAKCIGQINRRHGLNRPMAWA